jgi:hypothetical protein
VRAKLVFKQIITSRSQNDRARTVTNAKTQKSVTRVGAWGGRLQNFEPLLSVARSCSCSTCNLVRPVAAQGTKPHASGAADPDGEWQEAYAKSVNDTRWKGTFLKQKQKRTADRYTTIA